jgi:hypothetical protein
MRTQDQKEGGVIEVEAAHEEGGMPEMETEEE